MFLRTASALLFDKLIRRHCDFHSISWQLCRKQSNLVSLDVLTFCTWINGATCPFIISMSSGFALFVHNLMHILFRGRLVGYVERWVELDRVLSDMHCWDRWVNWSCRHAGYWSSNLTIADHYMFDWVRAAQLLFPEVEGSELQVWIVLNLVLSQSDYTVL